jgi:hypothetical protein
MALALKNLLSSCFSHPNVGITDVHHHTWLWEIFFSKTKIPKTINGEKKIL